MQTTAPISLTLVLPHSRAKYTNFAVGSSFDRSAAAMSARRDF